MKLIVHVLAHSNLFARGVLWKLAGSCIGGFLSEADKEKLFAPLMEHAAMAEEDLGRTSTKSTPGVQPHSTAGVTDTTSQATGDKGSC